jgi:AraC-like DNA-binding protein
MKDELTAKYFPITANPHFQSNAHMEILPCDALRPYVRCFWGSAEPTAEITPSLVIPDTCMDIIFNIDYTENTINSGFCTIDETGHYVGQTDGKSVCSTFAVRFYAWSAVLFANNSFADSKNKCFDTDEFFSGLKADLMPILMNVTSLQKRSELVSKYLLKRLDTNRMNNNMMNAVYDIISTRGTITTSEIAAKNAVSKRHLERIFNENIGISPKRLTMLVRYQMLWQELCFKGGDMLDMTEKYGYYDQAHMLNDFRKRHCMTPRQAVEFAGNNVAFLQYKPQKI